MPTEDRDLRAAALLGLGGGLRSFASPVALAAHGLGPLAGPARFIPYGAAVGEVIADKLPQMPSRWSRRGLTLRLGFSSIGGHELAGWPGAGVAGAAALTSAFIGSRLRVMVHDREAQFAAAVFEDSLTYALVFAAMRGRD
ncbi:MAG TPA: hypothetical protein VFI54_19475 [Solirubrobacteraceae bacterium]|nr:hypothetical protein [Solirubrobacteraceae bacterium]